MPLCPFAQQMQITGSVGAYAGGPFKIVHHTTEGGSAASAFEAYRANRSDPHFTVDDTTIYQHIDTAVSARSLKNASGGVQTNRDSAIQIEVVGFAHLPKSQATLRNVARLCRWIEATHGVARVWPNGPPKPARNGRDPGGHNRDAATWDLRSGHYGHSQVPENDHWDPAYTDAESAFVLGFAPDADDAGKFDKLITGNPKTGADLAAAVSTMPDHADVAAPRRRTRPAWVRRAVNEDGLDEVPLFGAPNDRLGRLDALEYDEDGSLALARALSTPPAEDRAPIGRTSAAAMSAPQPIPLGDLNGSWFIQFVPKGPHELTFIRGPLRIEVSPPKLRISGDVYVKRPDRSDRTFEMSRPITDDPLLFGSNWYPQLPRAEYSWYFRSLGVTYNRGKLVFKFERYLWNGTTQEFVSQHNSGRDNAFMEFECRADNILTHPLLPQPTLKIEGTAHIGGEVYDVVATKTSPFHRGCAVEVDVMANRSFPMSATAVNGSVVSFESIFRSAGMDCPVTLDQVDLPDDEELTSIELETALTNNQLPQASPTAWRLWLVVGSSQGSLFGLMFNDSRRGTAGFFDSRLPGDQFVSAAARNKRIGDVSTAFLRTLVHEAGHAFNLYHPKSDVHSVPIGTTIMNQTGDVMGFASPSNPYPDNITFAFDDHNRSSLIHSPDPQIAPGWKRFGWGHGGLSSGIAEPVDAAGILHTDAVASGLELILDVPENVFRGQFVSARFTLRNTGNVARRTTAALNLAQGDLRLLLKPPAQDELDDVRDMLLACGDRPFAELNPGESLTGNAQIFFTNLGLTFRHTGRYFLSAELDIGDGSGEVVRSAAFPVVVRAPATAEEEDIAALSMTTGVGKAFAFGDFGEDQDTLKRLKEIAKYQSETGLAAAMVLANAARRGLRDLRTGKVVRRADLKEADTRMAAAADALAGRPVDLVLLASAVASPAEASAPVIEMTDQVLRDLEKKAGGRRRAASAAGGDDGGPAARSAARAIDLLADIRRTLPHADWNDRRGELAGDAGGRGSKSASRARRATPSPRRGRKGKGSSG